MALFSKGDSLDAQLKKLRTGDKFSSSELGELLARVSEDPDFGVSAHLWMFTHDSKPVRDCVSRMSRGIAPNRDLADRLAKLLVADCSTVRMELARTLTALAPERVKTYLGNLIYAKDDAAREAGVELIAAQSELVEFLPFLKATLRDGVSRVRYKTARILAGVVDNQTVFTLLRNKMNEDDEPLRHIVIEALTKNPNPDVIEPLFERLPHEGLEIRNLILRALKSLARSNPRDMESRILPMLADEDAGLRGTAASLLKEMPDHSQILRTYIEYSAGLSFWLRERSYESICKVAGDVVETLTALMEDECEAIRVGAMALAATSDDPRLLPGLTSMLDSDSDWWIRSMAVGILARFREEPVTVKLVAMLHDSDLRHAVIGALGQHANETALKALLGCLADPSRSVRRSTIEALDHIEHPLVDSALEELAIRETDPRVQVIAAEKLEARGTMTAELQQRLNAAPVDDGPETGLVLEMVNDLSVD